MQTSEVQHLVSKHKGPWVQSAAQQKRRERKKVVVTKIDKKLQNNTFIYGFYSQCEAEKNLSKASSMTE